MSGGSEHRGLALARLVRAAGETLLWWVTTCAVWMATLSPITASELAVAAGCTLPCAAMARLARRANGGSWRFRLGWLMWAAIVARDVPIQTIQAWLYVLSARRRRAAFATVPLPAEDERTAAGRRALSTLSFATTPGTVVCDSNARLSRVLLHRLGQGQGRLELAVQR